jgi:cysteinyl-tRNA synthetase
MLKIYNTIARTKQEFHPIESGKVRMYVCGMTVYDYCHIGHARMMMAFDITQRWLRASGYAVTYVRNITDIDDKIIKRAVENGETIGELTRRFIAFMHEDIAALGIEPPDAEPRATDYVPQMLGLIEKLEHKGLAYQAVDGDVNFAVRKFPQYGRLSGKSLDELRAGERIAIDAAKNDPLDFVLWKHTKPGEPKEAIWPSAWGDGRPGWHIECSAMSCSLLGERFDIHGGGADLQFPHHENELAQSEGASGSTFVNYWMHNGFLNVDNEKMSKSLGNFFTIRDVLKHYDPEVLRFFLLRTHYRSPFNYSDTNLDDARNALTRLYTALKEAGMQGEAGADTGAGAAAPAVLAAADGATQRFVEAMNDDFNTPIAVAVLFELAGELNRSKSAEVAHQLRALAGLLGLLKRDPTSFLQSAAGAAASGPDAASIETAIAQRSAAKKARNFAEADRIRADLLAQNVVLEDSASGTVWRRA